MQVAQASGSSRRVQGAAGLSDSETSLCAFAGAPVPPALPPRNLSATPCLNFALGLSSPPEPKSGATTGAAGNPLRQALKNLLHEGGAEKAQTYPLHAAIVARPERLSPAELELCRGPGLAQRNQFSHTPLLSAVLTGNVAAAIQLCAAGADRTAADVFGNRPLHWAVILENRQMEKILAGPPAVHQAQQQARNVFLARPEDYRPPACSSGRGDSSAESAALFSVYGAHQSFRTGSRADFQRLTGAEYLDRSHLHPDFFLQMAIVAAKLPIVPQAVELWGRAAKLGARLSSGPLLSPAALCLRYLGGVFGWGVFVLRDVAPGENIGIYTGEVIHGAVIAAEKQAGARHPCSAHLVVDHEAVLSSTLDASRAGNLMSRINEGDPAQVNLVPILNWCDGYPATVFQASRSIRAGEQLLVSYGSEYWQDGQPQPMPAKWLRLPRLPLPGTDGG